jgi:GTP:adenosylcobinamide-phosphate guanylyltransferase
VVKAPGQGYIQDYTWASKRLGLQGPVLIIAADLPLIGYRLIDRIIERHVKAESSALGVYPPYEFCYQADVLSDLTCAADANLLVPTGINSVDVSHLDQSQEQTMFVIRDEPVLYNINRRSDLKRLSKSERGRRRELE